MITFDLPVWILAIGPLLTVLPVFGIWTALGIATYIGAIMAVPKITTTLTRGGDFNDVIDDIVGIVPVAGPLLSAGVQEANNESADWGMTALNTVVDAATLGYSGGLGETVQAGMEGAVAAAGEFISPVTDALNSVGTGVWDAIQPALGAVNDAVVEPAQAAFNKLVGEVGNLGSTAQMSGAANAQLALRNAQHAAAINGVGGSAIAPGVASTQLGDVAAKYVDSQGATFAEFMNRGGDPSGMFNGEGLDLGPAAGAKSLGSTLKASLRAPADAFRTAGEAFGDSLKAGVGDTVFNSGGPIFGRGFANAAIGSAGAAIRGDDVGRAAGLGFVGGLASGAANQAMAGQFDVEGGTEQIAKYEKLGFGDSYSKFKYATPTDLAFEKGMVGIQGAVGDAAKFGAEKLFPLAGPEVPKPRWATTFGSGDIEPGDQPLSYQPMTLGRVGNPTPPVSAFRPAYGSSYRPIAGSGGIGSRRLRYG